jgi:hypothetical protein
VPAPLTLTIHDDKTSTDYVYGDDRLLVDVETKDKRVQDLDIEIENIPMQVGPNTFGAPELVGYADPLAFPDRTYRAKLETGGGTLLMNGAVLGRDAIFDARNKSWQIELINQAPKEFWKLLKTEFLAATPASVQSTDVEVFEKQNTDQVERYVSTRRTFFQPRSVLQKILETNSISYSIPDPLWEYEISYDSASRTVTSESTRISLGSGNMRTLVEEISKMAGLRALVEYKTFPSEGLKVTFRKTNWTAPPATQTLDGQQSDESYAVTIEKNTDNWALQLRNGDDEASPNPIEESFEGARSEASSVIPSFAPPPTYGATAPQSWDTPPPEKEERSVIADPVETKFKVPPVAVEAELTVKSGTERVAIGPARHVSKSVRGTDSLQKNNELLIFEVKESPNDGNFYAVHSRRPEPSEYDKNETLSHNPAWASAVYEQQSLRRSSVRELEGDFIGVGEQVVGDPLKLVEFESKGWFVYDSSRDVSQKVSTLVLRRPLQVTLDSAMPEILNGDRTRWKIEKPVGEYRTLRRGNGKEDWILLHWNRAPVFEAVEVFYHVQIIDTRDQNPGWDTIAEIPVGRGQLGRTYSTASTYQFKSAGNGGANYSDADIRARVRPVKGQEIVTGRVEPIEGAWNEFPVEKA